MEVTRALVAGLYTLLVFCLCCVERGLGIKCYSCIPSPGVHGAECEKLSTYTVEERADYLHDCSIFGANYTMCRKMYQEIAGDIRVYHGCARLGEIGCIKRAGTYKIKTTNCHCNDKDGCNSAHILGPTLTTALLSSVIAGLINLIQARHV